MKNVKTLNKKIIDFQSHIWDFYQKNGRSFAWRNIDDPYKVVVSEIMLQQTQTTRVEEKYELFISELPSFNALAQASLRDVLSLWQGLGYNRRGRYLHQIAQRVVAEFNGILPNSPKVLEAFPGIGPATASSICTFAFKSPTVFIETNIRAVFIHFFFKGKEKVHDKEIMPLIEQTVDHNNPREWYYALMDYGVMLKKSITNPSRRSSHHTKQSRFEGSDRQIRGAIIRLLTDYEQIHIAQLLELIKKDEARVEGIVDQLIKEGFVLKKNQHISIAE
jgi:A/G-specific adenine glycosylase